MKSILVIDDDDKVRYKIADILKSYKFEIRSAVTGFNALSEINEKMPDLIFSDINVPEIDGFEVLEKLRSNYPDVLVPFVFITAIRERKSFRRAMELGADDYLTKPFTNQEFLSVVNLSIKRYTDLNNRINKNKAQAHAHLEHKLKELEKIVAKRDLMLNNVIQENCCLQNRLKDKQYKFEQEIFQVMEIKSTLRHLKNDNGKKLEKKGLTESNVDKFQILKDRLPKKPALSNNWAEFLLKTNLVHNNFTLKLGRKFPSLTQYDTIFVSATKMGMSTREIADLLSISVDSVRKSRYRIKKKIGLTSKDSFIGFIHSMI